jgi:hypothetical protein
MTQTTMVSVIGLDSDKVAELCKAASEKSGMLSPFALRGCESFTDCMLHQVIGRVEMMYATPKSSGVLALRRTRVCHYVRCSMGAVHVESRHLWRENRGRSLQ